MSVADIPIWEWCWMIFACISALMHCLVLDTIIRARRRRASNILKAPFFTIIFIQGIHELLELCTTTGFNRLRKYRIIKYAVEEDNELVEWQWYWYIFLKNILYFGHVEIAINRLTAVILTKYKRYDKLWNTRNIILMTIFGYCISAGLRAVVYRPSFKMTTYIFPGSDLFSFIQTGPLFAFENSADIALSFGTAVICTLCYSITAILQRKYSNMDSKTKKQESVLLKIGIATFLILLPTTVRSGLELWAHMTNKEEFLSFIIKWNILPAEAMCVFQPWLLLLSCRSLRESIFFHSPKVSSISSRAMVTSQSIPNSH